MLVNQTSRDEWHKVLKYTVAKSSISDTALIDFRVCEVVVKMKINTETTIRE